MPEEYALGNLPIYIKALSISKPMSRPTAFRAGRGGGRLCGAQAVRSSGGGRDLRLSKTYNDSS